MQNLLNNNIEYNTWRLKARDTMDNSTWMFLHCTPDLDCFQWILEFLDFSSLQSKRCIGKCDHIQSWYDQASLSYKPSILMDRNRIDLLGLDLLRCPQLHLHFHHACPIPKSKWNRKMNQNQIKIEINKISTMDWYAHLIETNTNIECVEALHQFVIALEHSITEECHIINLIWLQSLSHILDSFNTRSFPFSPSDLSSSSNWIAECLTFGKFFVAFKNAKNCPFLAIFRPIWPL